MLFEIIPAKDYTEMSELAAERIISLVKKQPDAVLGLATGSTPEGLYECLINDHKENGTSYRNVRTVNLDEYANLDPQDKNSYFTFMREHLFNHLDIPLEQTNIPNGMAKDPLEEAAGYDKKIQQLGGVDLQVLGIGHNGHIGFNEPGTPFSSRTHVVTLAESTRIANSRYFNSIEEVPTEALTMGIQSIMDSKEILLLISGPAKAETLKKLVFGEISEDFPASVLRLHQKVTVIADQEAMKPL